MNKNELINDLVIQWIRIADRDLIAGEQGLKGNIIISEGVCFHCQQAVEKYLKAFLVKYQIEFPKTHSIMTLINLCSEVDNSFEKLSHIDAYGLALDVKKFIRNKLMIQKS